MTAQPTTKLEHYERRVGRWSRRIAPRFLEWLGRETGGRWLDVGCGGGALGQAILDRCGPVEVASVDEWEEAIATLVSTRAGPCVVGSAEALPFESARFDAVVSALMLNAMGDPLRGVREMRRVVAPGGVIAGYVWDFAGKMEVTRAFWDAAIALDDTAREKDQGVRFSLSDPDRLTALFSDAGLFDVETTALDDHADFADFADYWSPWVDGDGSVVRYVQSLSDEAREALRAQLDDTLPRNDRGGIRLSIRAWAIRGRPDG